MTEGIAPTDQDLVLIHQRKDPVRRLSILSRLLSLHHQGQGLEATSDQDLVVEVEGMIQGRDHTVIVNIAHVLEVLITGDRTNVNVLHATVVVVDLQCPADVDIRENGKIRERVVVWEFLD